MKKIVLICSFLLSFTAHAQKDITLVVASNGNTQGEAIHTALRDAIEQSFGALISSNTKILGDAVIQDEIVSLSTGNIKKYTILSSSEHNGKSFVTLSVVVSRKNLETYARSKGSSCEFAGALFSENLRLNEMYAKNEELLIQNKILEFTELLPDCFNYKISLEKPQFDKYNQEVCIKGEVHVTLNKQGKNLVKQIFKLFKDISISPEEFLRLEDGMLPNYERDEYNGYNNEYNDVRLLLFDADWLKIVDGDLFDVPSNDKIVRFRSHKSLILIHSFLFYTFCQQRANFIIKDNNGKNHYAGKHRKEHPNYLRCRPYRGIIPRYLRYNSYLLVLRENKKSLLEEHVYPIFFKIEKSEVATISKFSVEKGKNN